VLLYHTSHRHAPFTTLPSSSLLPAPLTNSKVSGGSDRMHVAKTHHITLPQLLSSAAALD